MAQIFVFGASTPYGVGGSEGGWPDILKRKLHKDMYLNQKLPIEKHEIYNFCLPGATISNIEKRFEAEVGGYSKPKRGTVIVIMLGGNDAKATEQPDNFVNTPEGFYEQMKELTEKAKEYTNKVMLIGMKPVDEGKTTPKINPNTGGGSYFFNDRIKVFEDEIAKVAGDSDVRFVPIFDKVQKLDWYFHFEDGLHPNDKGHKWLYDEIWPELNKAL